MGTVKEASGVGVSGRQACCESCPQDDLSCEEKQQLGLKIACPGDEDPVCEDDPKWSGPVWINFRLASSLIRLDRYNRDQSKKQDCGCQ